MDVSSTVIENQLIMVLNDSLYLHNAQDFKYIFNSLVERDLDILIDMSNVKDIDEVGLACLHYCHELAFQYNSRVFMYRPAGKVKRVLQMTRSYDYFDIIDHRDLSIFSSLQDQSKKIKEVA
jgi:anti-anti-sigma factor